MQQTEHKLAKNREQEERQKKEMQIPVRKQWKVGKGWERGKGGQLDLFTSILQCGIGFDRVVSASNFCLKV